MTARHEDEEAASGRPGLTVSGAEARVGKWAGKYWEAMTRVATRVLEDPDAAEDVVQRAFMAALSKARRGADEIEGIRKPRRWMLRITRNMASDVLKTETHRRRRRRENGDDIREVLFPERDAGSERDTQADRVLEAAQRVLTKRQFQVIRLGLDACGPPERYVLTVAAELIRPVVGRRMDVVAGLPLVLVAVAGVAMGLCAMVVGCSDSQQVAVADGGMDVAIVDNALGIASAETWSLSGTADIVIESEGTVVFDGVRDVRLLDGGGVVVLNGLELLWFDGGGGFVRESGGRGEGPSESLAIFGLEVLRGDSAMVVSKRPSALKLFGPNGEFSRAIGIRSIPEALSLRWRGTDGWLAIVFGGEPRFGDPGTLRELWHIVRVTPDLRSGDTVMSLNGRLLSGNRQRSVYVSGGPGAYVGAGANVIAAGVSDTYRLLLFDRSVTLYRVIDNSVANPSGLELVPAPSRRGTVLPEGGSRLTMDTPSASGAPAYDGVVVSNDGTIWVRRFAGPDGATVWANTPWSSTPSRGDEAVWVARGFDGQEWHVFDDDGAIMARAMLPARLRPTEMTETHVAGVWTDELGVESVRVFGINRR